MADVVFDRGGIGSAAPDAQRQAGTLDAVTCSIAPQNRGTTSASQTVA